MRKTVQRLVGITLATVLALGAPIALATTAQAAAATSAQPNPITQVLSPYEQQVADLVQSLQTVPPESQPAIFQLITQVFSQQQIAISGLVTVAG